jgi:hypothetical protein
MSISDPQPSEQALGEAHGAIVQQILATGRCPSRFQLANGLKTTVKDVEVRLRCLETKHGIMLHPHEPECG